MCKLKYFGQVPQSVITLELVMWLRPPSIPPKNHIATRCNMNKKRQKQIIFRLSESEAEKLKKNIERSGRNQQEYLVACALQKKITNTDGIKMLLPELKRIGSNLNQITKVLNATGQYEPQLMTENQKELNDLWQQLRQQIARLD